MTASVWLNAGPTPASAPLVHPTGPPAPAAQWNDHRISDLDDGPTSEQVLAARREYMDVDSSDDEGPPAKRWIDHDDCPTWAVQEDLPLEGTEVPNEPPPEEADLANIAPPPGLATSCITTPTESDDPVGASRRK